MFANKYRTLLPLLMLDCFLMSIIKKNLNNIFTLPDRYAQKIYWQLCKNFNVSMTMNESQIEVTQKKIVCASGSRMDEKKNGKLSQIDRHLLSYKKS